MKSIRSIFLGFSLLFLLCAFSSFSEAKEALSEARVIASVIPVFQLTLDESVIDFNKILKDYPKKTFVEDEDEELVVTNTQNPWRLKVSKQAVKKLSEKGEKLYKVVLSFTE